jgi:phosphatidylglycerophosphate synthase
MSLQFLIGIIFLVGCLLPYSKNLEWLGLIFFILFIVYIITLIIYYGEVKKIKFSLTKNKIYDNIYL